MNLRMVDRFTNWVVGGTTLGGNGFRWICMDAVIRGGCGRLALLVSDSALV